MSGAAPMRRRPSADGFLRVADEMITLLADTAVDPDVVPQARVAAALGAGSLSVRAVGAAIQVEEHRLAERRRATLSLLRATRGDVRSAFGPVERAEARRTLELHADDAGVENEIDND
jgi:hypothetical protein